MEWQIGDRVVCIADCPDNNEDIVEGVTGCICHIEGYGVGRNIGVCWDIRVDGGHDCHGHCDNGYGWFVYEDEIAQEPMSDFDAATDDELVSFLGIGGG